MKYKDLFFDLDHTLWDFDANSRLTLLELYDTYSLKEKGVEDFDNFHNRYLEHNSSLWAKYRQRQIQQAELRVKRMRLSLLDFKIGDSDLADQLSKTYLDLLPTRSLLFPYTIEILEYLKHKGYRLHLITNGFEEIQHNKINNSRINHYFDKIVTSELSNSLKPHKEIFDFAIAAANARVSESIMLGDDLDADIIGASKAGLDQVYINHHKKPHEYKPTYEVFALNELELIF